MAWMAAYQWLWAVGIVAGMSVEFPNPQREFRLCGRKNASFICDPEFILDVGDVERLDQLAHEFQKSTNCLCSSCDTGISLGIFIRSKLTQESMEKYPSGKNVAEMLRKRWHLGKCNDDIVIVLLTEMNISDYSLGLAVQEVFPDKTAGLIMKDCRVHFLSGWYYQGLESVATSFNDVLVKLQKKSKTFNKSLITGLSLGLGVMLILIILAILLLRRQNKRRKEGFSNIYETVPTKSNCGDFVNVKINEYQLDKFNTPENKTNDDDEQEDDESDEDDTLSRQFLHFKRQLSAVVEESDDNEAFKENSWFNKSPYSPQSTNRSLQVTEL